MCTPNPLTSVEAHTAWVEGAAGGSSGRAGNCFWRLPHPPRHGPRVCLLTKQAGHSGVWGMRGSSAPSPRWLKKKIGQLYPARRDAIRFPVEGGHAEVFLDVTTPPLELALFGAGHDAIPLARYAHDLGFRVTVIDARPAFLTPERFPQRRAFAHSPLGFCRARHPRQAFARRDYEPSPRTRHREPCFCALQPPRPYIGVLGPAFALRADVGCARGPILRGRGAFTTPSAWTWGLLGPKRSR